MVIVQILYYKFFKIRNKKSSQKGAISNCKSKIVNSKMLNRIFIQNFALIDQLEIHLQKGLQVITGETGAGKSIILGALRLIMGERADLKNFRQIQKPLY